MDPPAFATPRRAWPATGTWHLRRECTWPSAHRVPRTQGNTQHPRGFSALTLGQSLQFCSQETPAHELNTGVPETRPRARRQTKEMSPGPQQPASANRGSEHYRNEPRVRTFPYLVECRWAPGPPIEGADAHDRFQTNKNVIVCTISCPGWQKCLFFEPQPGGR